jgi:hypothetical protein
LQRRPWADCSSRLRLQKPTLSGYTLTDINVPGAYVVLSIDNLGRSPNQFGRKAGFRGFSRLLQ